MKPYSVINLKTDPELKRLATETAERLGISISAVLNNELRRFTVEQRVSFQVPEIPNQATAEELARSRKEIDGGDVHRFPSNESALEFLDDALA